MKRDWGKDLHLGSGKRTKNDEATRCGMRALAETYSTEAGPPSTSQSKHKIFLSHSGAQKCFVKNLCKALEDHHRFPFLDIRLRCLPMGERFPEHIFEAAQQCSLAVVVVSEEYFTSKWPMIELVEFVRAKKSGRNPNLKILPLFTGLTVSEFGDQTRQEVWCRKWAEWAEEDPLMRINVAEYKEALKEVKAFNGMQFDQDVRKFASYQKNVVRMICKLVSPDVKWYDSHVQGGSNICEVYSEQISTIQPSGKHKVRVIGYYGVGGLGKTTMCKVLCNALALEFEDKVCHVEMAPNPSSSLKLLHLQEVLKKLTLTSEEVLCGLKEGEYKDILCKSVSWEQPAFLALDNLWDDSASIEHARMFLQEAAFPEGSVVMVAARTLRTLGYLGIDKSQCFEVPELSKVDARNLFLYHAANGRQYANKGDIYMIDKCVSRCYFRKSEKQGCHYLPLAVKVLGMHLGSLGSDPKQWLESLPRVRDFDLHSSEENPVYGVIRLNYDRLTLGEQALFMDIVCYHPYYYIDDNSLSGFTEWLGLVHRKKWEEIGVQLQRLKDKGLLEDVDVASGAFSTHDLYREFAKLEVQGKLKGGSFQCRRFVYANSHPSELEMMPSGGVWENLIRVGIEEEGRDRDEDCGISSLQGIQWRYCSNVVVLKVDGLMHLKGVLNLKGLSCLRSLDLYDLVEPGGVEGLEDLNNLTYFRWFVERARSKNASRPHLGQLPGSLKVLLVERVGVTVGRDVFARCTSLCNLALGNIRAHDGIDFGRCSSLQTLALRKIEGLQELTGLRTECLHSLRIRDCDDLRDVSGLEHSFRLRKLVLEGNSLLEEVLDVQKLTRLQILRIDSCDGISEVWGLDSLRQLRELKCWGLPNLSGLPSLSGLQHLHHLQLSGCKALTGLEGVGDLRSLRYLDLEGCSSLVRLPELSKCTNLEELGIWETAMELGEEDIVMLSKLPQLLPVLISHGWPSFKIKLDVVKRRVLKEKWCGGIEEERDLEMPPNFKLPDYLF
ncbi:hypothetical protein KC19_9G114400 [Ceratodon purpureus]|uniref:TIR domain-containing protein n=1 Tax=Ceratodon purpureus TaxID=3225 RepID=A0A8T0GWG5_CERPU|nr:hypothetical protein KC19_9G114400 [Ceratodon purpureus]